VSLQKTVRLNQLYDFYGELLTERQRKLFERYYHDDLSLAEIGEEFDISRQAVYDGLRRSEQALEAFERSLQLLARHQRQRRLLERLEAEVERLAQHVDPRLLEPLTDLVKAWREELEFQRDVSGEETERGR